jgi:hypothetical protein
MMLSELGQGQALTRFENGRRQFHDKLIATQNTRIIDVSLIARIIDCKMERVGDESLIGR